MRRAGCLGLAVGLGGCVFGSNAGQGTPDLGSSGEATTGDATTTSVMSSAEASTGGEAAGTATGADPSTGPGVLDTTGDTTGDSTGAASTDDTTGGASEPKVNCFDILADMPAATDGIYTIDVDGEGVGLDPFEVYCDMTTAGGGWTLVFAYEFTSYSPFVTAANAVSVRPNWPLVFDQSVPVSTTPPLGLDQPGAIDYALWPALGSSFFVRSNINNGIVCDELTGSLVSGMTGTIDCTLVEDVTGTCLDVVPDEIVAPMYGYGLRAGMLYYYWDGDTSMNWPTHDPCGTNMPNHLSGVADPFGAILVRP